MSQQKGRAVVFDVDGITFTAGIVSTATGHLNQSARFARAGDVARVRDGEGDEVNQTFYNRKKTLTITVIPAALVAGNTFANANTFGDNCTPKPGTTITVADADGTLIDASYNLISATQNRTNTDAMAIDLELEQGDEAKDLTLAPS